MCTKHKPWMAFKNFKNSLCSKCLINKVRNFEKNSYNVIDIDNNKQIKIDPQKLFAVNNFPCVKWLIIINHILNDNENTRDVIKKIINRLN